MDNQNNGQDFNNMINELPKSNVLENGIVNPIQNVVDENKKMEETTVLNQQSTSSINQQSNNQNVLSEQNVLQEQVISTQNNEQPKVEETTNNNTISTGSSEISYGPTQTSTVIDIESNNSDLPTFNNNASTIGKIKPDKQKSPFTMLFLFVI